MIVKLALLLLTSNGYERERALPLRSRSSRPNSRTLTIGGAFSPARGVPERQGRSRARWWTIVRARPRAHARVEAPSKYFTESSRARVEFEVSPSLRRISSLPLNEHWPATSFPFAIFGQAWAKRGQRKIKRALSCASGKKLYKHTHTHTHIRFVIERICEFFRLYIGKWETAARVESIFRTTYSTGKVRCICQKISRSSLVPDREGLSRTLLHRSEVELDYSVRARLVQSSAIVSPVADVRFRSISFVFINERTNSWAWNLWNVVVIFAWIRQERSIPQIPTWKIKRKKNEMKKEKRKERSRCGSWRETTTTRSQVIQ